MIDESFRRIRLEVSGNLNTIRILAILTFLVQLHTFYGEDIVNARNNYLTGERTDFWGGVSTLVYAHLPSIGFRWQIWLGIIQIILTTIGIEKLVTIEKDRKFLQIPAALVIYGSLLFSSQLTRDSLMFSLLIFGIAQLKVHVKGKVRLISLIFPVLIIVFGMSFRPWLAAAITPVVLVIFNKSREKISKSLIVLIILFITIAPVIIEVTSTKIQKLEKSYPQQQVMLMDAAASYCYTTNNSTGARAKSALEIFYLDGQYAGTACQLYRPDTWLSLTKGGNTSSSGIEPKFSLIQSGDSKSYEKLKSIWFNMVLSDPITYLQNKMIFVGKLLIGSDSRNLSFFHEKEMLFKFLAVYRIPYDLAISLHLFSLLFICLALVISSLKRYRKQEPRGLFLDENTLYLLAAMLLWLGFSAIAYIGSNGRYTYTITLISMILFISFRQRNKDVGGVNG